VGEFGLGFWIDAGFEVPEDGAGFVEVGLWVDDDDAAVVVEGELFAWAVGGIDADVGEAENELDVGEEDGLLVDGEVGAGKGLVIWVEEGDGGAFADAGEEVVDGDEFGGVRGVCVEFVGVGSAAVGCGGRWAGRGLCVGWLDEGEVSGFVDVCGDADLSVGGDVVVPDSADVMVETVGGGVGEMEEDGVVDGVGEWFHGWMGADPRMGGM
jgi:hypothetical protein